MDEAKALKEKNTFFSVIIPAYNAEKTIQQCLERILGTDYSAIEVIVVSDGSTDQTEQIVSDYAAKDSRIRLITQKNQGPGAARNQGIRNAKGEVITFVDSDDFIVKNYFEALDKTFQQMNADVVYFEFSRVTEDDSIISQHKLPEIQKNYYHNLRRLSEEDIFGYTWVKAFRRSTLSNVYFNENTRLFEDEIFTTDVLKKTLRIHYLHEDLYHYVCTDTASLSRRTYTNYQELCDMVYHSWENLLINDTDAQSFLQEKANHFAFVCKYYGLERVKSSMSFFRDLSQCKFLADTVLDDEFLMKVRKKKWGAVRKEIMIYKAKTLVRKIIRNR